MNFLARAIIGVARRTPYTHLRHADGSLYMERYWLRPYREDRRGHAARVHHICTPDYDREMHDHPWDFCSIVLSGWYVEARPLGVELSFMPSGAERALYVERRAGSVAFRRATDRHRIVEVGPDTWTLFFTGPKRHWWGFHTPAGKVHWKQFESVHDAVSEERAA